MAEAKERREEKEEGEGKRGGQLICINSTFWAKAALRRWQFRLRPLSSSPVFRSKTLSPAAASWWSTNILAVNIADISLEGRRTRERD